MASSDSAKHALDNLLDLDGMTAEVRGGYWVSIRVGRVSVDAGRPHGIQYSMTLHEPAGNRVLGYDNAHAPKVRSGPGARSARPLAYDHVHTAGGRMVPYQFRGPADLMEDFWADVEALLKERGV